MPRFELVEGGSSKFWEIRREGARVIVRFGKIGAAGQTQIKDWADETEAQRELEKMSAAKTKKGYQPVDQETSAKKPSSTKAPPTQTAKRNPGLEAAILARPEDDEPFLVYADWLQTEGDPRGELAILHAGLQKNPKDKKLKTAAEKLLAANADHFWGKLKDLQDMLEDVTWRLGFIRSLKVKNVYARDEEFGSKQKPSVKVEELIGYLLDHPSGRFLEELTVGIVTFMDNSYTRVCNELGKRSLPTLRKLYLGDFNYEETELNWSTIGDAKNLYKGVPNLRSLTLRSGSMTLGKINLPELRELITVSGGMGRSATKPIGEARWPKLEKLSLQFGRDSDVKVKDLRPILEGSNLPALTHLGLTNAEFTDELCKVLPDAPILAQLEELDLQMGTMSDAGAQTLAARPEAFKHLLLNVDDNYLSAKSKTLLKKICKTLEFGTQREDEGEGSRYASAYE